MTCRERMLAAYQKKSSDRLPISPEIWSATVLEFKKEAYHRYLGPFADKDFIEAWFETQKYFGCDPWLLVDPDEPEEGENFRIRKSSYYLSDDVIETQVSIHTGRGELHSLRRTSREYDGWYFEHPVKDFERDMPAFTQAAMADPCSLKTFELERALRLVGEGGLVSANLGELFISFLAYARQGDIGQTLIDLYDHEEFIERLHADYIRYICGKVDRLSRVRGLDCIFINCGYSDGGLLGPDCYRRWEIPLLRAVADKAKEYGLVFHLHQHGKCRKLLGMIAQTGVDLVDSLERPSANGDVGDLSEVKRELGGRIALKGNIDPIHCLKNGTKEEIDGQVRECISAAAEGGGYILGTGDSVLEGTPFENIFELVEAGRKYGNLA